MQLQDFNHPLAGQVTATVGHEAPAEMPANEARDATEGSREQAEITLLKKRIEHLELVVETARSLMTSNQERLLRRLHDLPQELMVLTTVLNRLAQDEPSRVPSCEPRTTAPSLTRRVA